MVYVKRSGDRTDSLTLTRPGTSGPLTYRYVGSAFWQRTNIGTTTASGSIDAFVYGIPTKDADVPRTGSANYDIDLIGAMTDFSAIRGLAGGGTASVDFGTGNIIIIGKMDLIADGRSIETIDFSSNATLSSSANSFSGDFVFTQFQNFNGTLQGKLFGPAGEEIGASWSASDSTGRVATGTIMGRRGTADTSNGTFATPLTKSETFSTTEAVMTFKFDNQLGSNFERGDFRDIAVTNGPFTIRYDADTNRYIYRGTGLAETYDANIAQFINLGPTKQVEFSRSATENQILGNAFNYVASNYLLVREGDNFRLNAFVFGFPTVFNDIPTTGTASYLVRVDGQAADNAYRNPMVISGTGELLVEFGTGKLTANVPINYAEWATASGIFSETATGNWIWDGQIAAGRNEFNGTVTMTGIGDYSGSGKGQFFGPGARELGGSFTATRDADGMAIGTFKGVLDPTKIPPPAGSIASLTTRTSLTAVDDSKPSDVGAITGIVYDPATKGYIVSFANFPDVALDDTTRDSRSGESDQFWNFSQTLTDSTGAIRDWVSQLNNAQGTNPLVALTYSNFGRIGFASRAVFGSAGWDYNVFSAGLPTTDMPTTGTASYTGATMGYVRVDRDATTGGNLLYLYYGTVGLNADFGRGSITATFADFNGELSLQENGSGAPRNRVFEGFTLGGLITGSTFAGQEQQGDWLRRMNGAFYGPGAAEAGGTFRAERGNPSGTGEVIRIDGSFGAGKD
ncbi:transferrin-binding protein-like solute binding protein [Qipengyuania gaetbuli]|uniref:transferrin-binding protein-like solute binding protein n=1 Tax=Qipengyuania gaetbuli TaxID=266952 RepID=UPI001CFEA05E|nr:transferrin-binding protein-like solute binding protein [Qipengyuania gaetbuli]